MSTEITDFGNWLAVPSVVCLWFAVLMRTRAAARSQQQRGLWLAVASAAAAMTLNLPDVVDFAMRNADSTHAVALARNMVGVLSAGAVLYFVAASMGGRRLKTGSAVTAGVMMAILLALDLAAPPHGAHGVPPVGDPTPSTAYWLTLIAAHLLANVICVFVCWRYSGHTESRSLALCLRLFGLGTALAGLFWFGYLLRITLDSTWSLPYLPLLMNLHGLLRAAAILVPTAVALRRASSDISAAWRLWPLWRDLVRAVPHVALAEPRPRLVELLRPPAPRRLLVYRKVIESRDAILILNDYIEPHVPDLARSHVAASGVPPTDRDAAVLACVVKEARRAKANDLPQQRSSFSTPTLASSDLDAEKRFLVNVAQAYGSASTRSFKPPLPETT
ncbi:MAB_1171c family putative transporter [Streptomyces sp. E11-3]|uniref:MAB_1171c family putative transporter n=1 Tax=Streptomyces sp. E11-3 TaxID=3110112 RepID=UPI003980D3A1